MEKHVNVGRQTEMWLTLRQSWL